jgi:hypothetical protein
MIIYKFIKYLIINIKYTRILKQVYNNENIINNLSELFGTKFRIDWIGRLYTIINPNLINGEHDINTQIFEYGDNGLSNEIYVEKYIMQKLNIASNFIKANNLFDLLTYKIEKIDEYDNYLFIIQPISLDDCLKNTKHFCILISLLVVIGISLIIIF